MHKIKKQKKFFSRKYFLFKKKFLFNILISMKFFLEIHQVSKNLKSFFIFFPSSKFSQKNPLKKIFFFLGWIYFGNFFWDNFELGKKINNDFGFIITWYISKKNFIEIGILNIYFFFKRKLPCIKLKSKKNFFRENIFFSKKNFYLTYWFQWNFF